MSFRAALRPLKRAADAATQRLWALGFASLRAISDPSRWSSPGNHTVLVVAPHPDDEAIGCAGTILLHGQAGDQVHIAVATDGRQSKALPDPNVMALQRHREALAAAGLMNVERLAWLGLPEGDCTTEDLKSSLAALLQRVQPDLVYAPSRIDFHPEHFKVAHALALALELNGHPEPAIRIYPIQVPLTAILCNLVTDTSPVAGQCAAVLATYTSQSATVQSTLRQRHYSALRHGLRAQAEEFWEVTTAGYIALHATNPELWPAAFRGVRYSSFSDPLAYCRGRAERQRLRETARDAHRTYSRQVCNPSGTPVSSTRAPAPARPALNK